MTSKWPISIPINSVDADELSEFFSAREGKTRFRPLGKSSKIDLGLSFNAQPNLNFWEDVMPSGATIDIIPYLDNIGLTIPVSGSCDFQTSAGAFQASGSKAIISHDFNISRVQRNPGSHLRVISIPRANLTRALSSQIGEPVDKKLDFLSEINLNNGENSVLKHLAQMFSDGLVGSDIFCTCPIAAADISEALFTAILTKIPHNLSHLYERRTYSGGSWQLRRAIEYMVEHAGEAIKSEDIAAACNISVSSLYKMFQEQRATTPKLMLRQIRLKAARDDIMNPYLSCSISHIGRKWGFTNMGDFAAQFQKAFGVLPSQMDKKIRRRQKT